MTERKWRGFLLGEIEWEKGGEERENQPLGTGVQKRREERKKDRKKRETERDRERELGGGQGPFKRGHGECL